MLSRALRLAALFPLSLPLLLSPAGCHRTIPSICRQTCECTPCTDADLETCITNAETALEAIKDCDEQLDAYLACYDENLSCQNGAGVGTEACAAEETKLRECSGLGNPFQTACEQASIKIAMCSGSPAPPDVECNAMNECSSRCVLETSCDVLIGMSFSEEFEKCVQACFQMGGGGVGGAGGGGLK